MGTADGRPNAIRSSTVTPTPTPTAGSTPTAGVDADRGCVCATDQTAFGAGHYTDLDGVPSSAVRVSLGYRNPPAVTHLRVRHRRQQRHIRDLVALLGGLGLRRSPQPSPRCRHRRRHRHRLAAPSPVSDRCAYGGVAENSLYIDPEHGGKASVCSDLLGAQTSDSNVA